MFDWVGKLFSSLTGSDAGSSTVEGTITLVAMGVVKKYKPGWVPDRWLWPVGLLVATLTTVASQIVRGQSAEPVWEGALEAWGISMLGKTAGKQLKESTTLK